jgi:hypothetical protein
MIQVQFTIILYIYVIFYINLDDIGAKILLDVCSTTTTTDGQASMEIGGCRQPESNGLDGKILNKII